MNSITIITIVVVALLTVIIFGLTWLAYSSCLKSYRLEVSHGLHDKTIFKEYHSKKKKKVGDILGLISSCAILLMLLSLFTTGIIYKARGENFVINNQTALVIKSGSMSDYYDETRANECSIYPQYHFDIGDICIFEKVAEETELKTGEVYGYNCKGIIITHRLYKQEGEYYIFRGDNNSDYDHILVPKDKIVYHYVGKKVPVIGAFILYAQSYFGIWSLVGIIGIAISSEIVYHKIDKINRERDKQLFLFPEEPKKELKTKKCIKRYSRKHLVRRDKKDEK